MRCGVPRLLLLAATLCMTGCGSGKGPIGTVTGRVTFQGKPVAVGTVVFQNDDGSVSVLAPLREDGTFQVTTHDRKGLPPGKYRVAVKPTTVSDGPPPLAGPEKEAPAPNPLIPAKFHSAETSGLTAEVRAGENAPLEFELDARR